MSAVKNNIVNFNFTAALKFLSIFDLNTDKHDAINNEKTVLFL